VDDHHIDHTDDESVAASRLGPPLDLWTHEPRQISIRDDRIVDGVADNVRVRLASV
jgi:hypothetical protein